MTALFITATGTGVGKTLVTRILCHQARAAGRIVTALKPVISGFDPADAAASDSGQILAALGKPATPQNIAAISPWRFAAPLSPDMAASREDRDISFGHLVSYCRAAIAEPRQLALIEGVGGAFVPLGGHLLVADWIAAVDLPFIVVAGTYLGTLSHTLAVIEALAARGLHPAALVLSDSGDNPVRPEETRAALTGLLPGLPILVLPRLRQPEDAPDLLGPLGL